MSPTHSSADRRAFLKQSSAVVGASILAGSKPLARASIEDTLKVALVGCGGRGTGAAAQALSTAGPVRLVAMADAFSDRLEGSLKHLMEIHPERVDVPETSRFVGFDAYRKAIEADVDVVILATPPGFRPMHFAHAVENKRHVFMEKPVAVDGPGVRMVLDAARVARENDLKVGVGLQRHHERKYLETVRRIREGAIGDILYYRCYWNSAGVWVKQREEGQSEMEYQMRNWYYFNWLCGDHITEQHIHNIDVCNWIQGAYPEKAQGQGGRLIRTGKQFGEIYDHHAVEFTYPDGTKMFSQCRHQDRCWNSVSEHAHGTHGTADVSRGLLRTRDGKEWSFQDENPNPYQVEHDNLFAAIRNGTPHNEAEYGAKSTMTSVLGRMATYSGREVKWEEALNSDLALVPSAYTWDGTPPTQPDENGHYPIPLPGEGRVL